MTKSELINKIKIMPSKSLSRLFRQLDAALFVDIYSSLNLLILFLFMYWFFFGFWDEFEWSVDLRNFRK